MKRFLIGAVLAIAALHCSKGYDELMQEAVEARKASNYKIARQRLFAALEKKQTAEAYKELGNVVLLGEQNLIEAESFYLKALEIDKTYINAQFNMAVINLRRYEQTIGDNGKGNEDFLNEADKWFKKVYEQNPNFGVGLEELGKYYYYRHDYKKALEIVQKALGADARNAGAYSLIGQIYYGGLKDYQQAFDNFEQARTFNNKDLDVVYFLWVTSEKLAKKQDAEQYKTRYEQMLKQDGLTPEKVRARIRFLENQLKG